MNPLQRPARAAHRPVYPLSAVVGQDELILALLLAAVDRGIGGVLLRGQKGSAKTTAARGLASVLPGQAPFVELPVGASEDRVVGTVDLKAVLRDGDERFSPGLLAAADRGVLYVDEVNLLPDHIVDVLLDVAASGVNRVEREGISHEHPSRFVLLGSMNPEEGELRPQFLDRFGLAVRVSAPTDALERAEAVQRRLAFDADPQAFVAQWADEERALAHRLAGARPAPLAAGLVEQVARLCVVLGAEGLRGDLVCCRAAAALAGWEGRLEAGEAEVRQVAGAALAHRRRRSPFESPELAEEELERALDEAFASRGAGAGTAAGTGDGTADGLRHGGNGTRDHATGPEAGTDGAGAGERSFGARAWGTGGSASGAASPRSAGGDAIPADGTSSSVGGTPSSPGGGGASEPGIVGTDGGGSSTGARGSDYGAEDEVSRSESRHAAFGAGDSSPGSSGPSEAEPVASLARALLDGERRMEPGRSKHVGTAGRRSLAEGPRGRRVGSALPDGPVSQVAVGASLRAAAARGAGQVEAGDIRQAVFEQRTGQLVVLAVDASGSMGAQRRMEAAVHAALGLLLDAYQRRDRVALVTFGGERASVALAPTGSVEVARARLSALTTGGRTPLAEGIVTALEVAGTATRSGHRPLVVLITDGRATAGPPGLDPLSAALSAAGEVRRVGMRAVVIDAEDGDIRLGLAGAVAEAMGARYVAVGELTGDRIAEVVRAQVLDDEEVRAGTVLQRRP